MFRVESCCLAPDAVLLLANTKSGKFHLTNMESGNSGVVHVSLSLSELTATFKVFFQEEDNTTPDTHSLGGV
jgi:hypothetical protein